MKRLKSTLILFTTIFVVAFVTSCRDEFTEEQAIQAQADAAAADAQAGENALTLEAELNADEIRLRDSLLRVGGRVQYTVSVVDAGNAVFHGGEDDWSRIKGTEAVTGAVVTVAQNGVIASATTGADGLAVFGDLRVGNVAVHVAVTDFTDVDFVADLTPTNNSGYVEGQGTQLDLTIITRNAATQIPVFPTTGANTSTISGKVTYESDLTNATAEIPATNVVAAIDVDGSFIDTYIEPDGAAPNEDAAGRVLRISYASAGVSGAVDATTGAYSLTVPASLQGLKYNVGTSDVIADQTLLEETMAADMQYVTGPQVYRAVFGDEVNPTDIPDASAAWVTFSAPVGVTGGDNDITAATATATISAPGTFETISVTTVGEDYTQAPDVSFAGNTSGTGAAATATVSTDGILSGVDITNAGTGYSNTNNVVLEFGGDDALAIANVTFSIDEAKAANGMLNGVYKLEDGTGGSTADEYTSVPTASFDNTGSGAGTGATALVFMSVSDQTDVTTIGSGYDIGATASVSAPNDILTGNAVQATANPTVLGPIDDVVHGTEAYFLATPVVTFTPLQGATATATLSTDGRLVAGGGGVTITAQGTGFESAPDVAIAGTGTAQVTDMEVDAVTTSTPGVGYIRSSDEGASVTIAGAADGTMILASATLANGVYTTYNGGTLPGPDGDFTASTNATWTFDAGTGSVIVVTGVVNANGALQSISITTQGTGWTGGADPVFNPALATDDPGTEMNAGNLFITFGAGAVTVGARGSYLANPAVTYPAPSGGDPNEVTATGVSTLRLTAIDVIQQGGGYTVATPPVVTIGGVVTGGGAGATADAVVEAQIDDITLTNGGNGYGLYGNPAQLSPVPAVYFDGTEDTDALIPIDGSIQEIFFTNNGKGYSAAPTITFAGTGSAATSTGADIKLNAANSYMLVIAGGGSGYIKDEVAVSFSGGGDTGLSLDPDDPTAGDNAIQFNAGVIESITLLTGGSGYTAVPWVEVSAGGLETNYTELVATVTSGAVSAITIANPRTDYTGTPTVKIKTWKTAGTIAAKLTTGSVIGINITTAGAGYDVVPDVIFYDEGPGSGAAATATIVDGRVDAVTITAGGSGYTSAPSVDFHIPNRPYVAQGKVVVNEKGVVSSVSLWDLGIGSTVAGFGYVTPPTVTISPSMTGIGSGATAVADISSTGQVSSVTITNGGGGYFAQNTPDYSFGWAIWPAPSGDLVVYANKNVVMDINLGTGTRAIQPDPVP